MSDRKQEEAIPDKYDENSASIDEYGDGGVYDDIVAPTDNTFAGLAASAWATGFSFSDFSSTGIPYLFFLRDVDLTASKIGRFFFGYSIHRHFVS